MNNFIRQKIIHCGKKNKKSEFIEVDLFPMFDKKKRKGARRIKSNITEPKQKNLNDKNARRYFIQLIKCNFTEEDMFVTLSYNNSNLPNGVKEAEKEVSNYLRRINNLLKNRGLHKAKYIYTTECGSKNKRLHHHLIISCCLSRDEVENLWRRPKKAGEKNGEKIGRVSSARLEFDEATGVERLGEYLSKDPQGKKRWKQSQSLIKPWSENNDDRFTRKKIDNMAMLPPDCEEVRRYWESKFKGYKLYKCMPTWNDEIKRWSIYLKMRLK